MVDIRYVETTQIRVINKLTSRGGDVVGYVRSCGKPNATRRIILQKIPEHGVYPTINLNWDGVLFGLHHSAI